MSSAIPRVGAAAVGAAAVHPVLAPLGAAATLRAAKEGGGGGSVRITRTQRPGGQRKATPIAAPRRAPRAYALRVSEFAAAAEHVLSDSCLTVEAGPSILHNLRDRRSSGASCQQQHHQQQQQFSGAAWVFSLALQTSML